MIGNDNGSDNGNYDNMLRKLKGWTEQELADLLDRFYVKRATLQKFVDAYNVIDKRIEELEQFLGKEPGRDLFMTNMGQPRQKRRVRKVDNHEYTRLSNDIHKLLQTGEMSAREITTRLRQPYEVVVEILRQMLEKQQIGHRGERQYSRWYELNEENSG